MIDFMLPRNLQSKKLNSEFRSDETPVSSSTQQPSKQLILNSIDKKSEREDVPLKDKYPQF